MLHFNISSNDLTSTIKQKFGEDITPTMISIKQFAGIFQNQTSIGEGSYGAIKRVFNIYQEMFVLKEFKDESSIYGAYREVSIMKKFNHPNILRLIGFYQIKQSQKLHILMEHCQHKSLKSFSPNLVQFTQQKKLKMVFDIFNGIYALHDKNIMHRDLKPENILIDHNHTAKICDFGFCTYDHQNEQSLQKSRKIGTPMYNSPETQNGFYTKKCDIYSFGLIVYYIFCNGQHMLKRIERQDQLRRSRKQLLKNLGQILGKSSIPTDIQQLIANTVTSKQEQRYSTKQVLNHLQKAIQERRICYKFQVEICKRILNTRKFKKSIDNHQVKEVLFKNSFPNNLTHIQTQMSPIMSISLKAIVRQRQSRDVSVRVQKMHKLLKSLGQIDRKGRLLKTISKVRGSLLGKTQKYFLGFGMFLIVQQRFLQTLKQIRLLLQETAIQKVSNDKEWGQTCGGMILQIKTNLDNNLGKLGNYLRQIKALIKPNALVTSQLILSFEKLKINQTKQKLDIQNYRKVEKSCLLQNFQFYIAYIQQRQSLSANAREFRYQFQLFLQRIYKNQSLQKQNQPQKISTLIKSIQRNLLTEGITQKK